MKSYKLKVCLLGDEGVGKTSLIRRYVTNEFREDYLRTMGALVSKKQLVLDVAGSPVNVDVMVWDIMGRREFVDLVGDAYFEFANGIIAVCDLTRKPTFESLRRWVDGVRSFSGDVPMVILANKADLVEARHVQEGEVAGLAQSLGASYFMTSAKTGQNVEEAFKDLSRAILTLARPEELHPV